MQKFIANLLERGFDFVASKWPFDQRTVLVELRLSHQHLYVGFGKKLPELLVDQSLLGEKVQGVCQVAGVHDQQVSNEVLQTRLSVAVGDSVEQEVYLLHCYG